MYFLFFAIFFDNGFVQCYFTLLRFSVNESLSLRICLHTYLCLRLAFYLPSDFEHKFCKVCAEWSDGSRIGSETTISGSAGNDGRSWLSEQSRYGCMPTKIYF